MTQSVTPDNKPAGSIEPFIGWLEGMGKTRQTGHRWCKQFPWMEDGIVNIFGRLYIKKATILEFERRAMAGEFHRDITPEEK
jgi:hypothetical protein